MPGLARIAVAQMRFPPVQQGQAPLRVARLVGQVVGPAAIGVDIVEMLPQAPGQQPTGDGEILVVPPGQPPAVPAALAAARAARAAWLPGRIVPDRGKHVDLHRDLMPDPTLSRCLPLARPIAPIMICFSAMRKPCVLFWPPRGDFVPA